MRGVCSPRHHLGGFGEKEKGCRRREKMERGKTGNRIWGFFQEKKNLNLLGGGKGRNDIGKRP